MKHSENNAAAQKEVFEEETDNSQAGMMSAFEMGSQAIFV